MAVEDTITAITSGTSGTLMWIIIIVGALVGMLLLGGGAFVLWNYKKRYNLRVEFKLPRSDGLITNGEWGKGEFNAKRGVVFLKRKGMKRTPMKVFDIKEYLQGVDLLTVIQVGPEDYRPVKNHSWSKTEVIYVDDKTGKEMILKEAIMNIKVDTGLNKAWKSAFDISAKKAYSIQSFLNQFQTPIAIGIVVLCVFVGIAILWSRLPTMCG
jgi:hypothetical protein